MRHRFKTVLTVLAIAIPGGALGQAEPDDALFSALVQCVDAVDRNDLAAMIDFDMAFDREEKPNTRTTNTVYSGRAETPLGNLFAEVMEREGIVFDCSTGSFPLDAKDVTYADAEATLQALYEIFLGIEHAHETLTDARYLGAVICPPGGGALSISAMSLDPVDPEILAVGRTEPITGALRFTVFRDNPKNHEFC